MITDSVPWREDLARASARLRSRLTQQRWSERTSYLVERDLLVGFYAIRRLIESDKTSIRVPRRRMPVRVLPLTGTEPHKLDRWSPWEHYDFDARSRGELDAQSLVHEFIHSFILMLSFDEDEHFTGVYVASDRTKKKRLYEVPLVAVIGLFEHVATEDLLFVAWQVGGASVRLSQHDFVEAGATAYEDESHTWVVEDPTFDDRQFATLADLTPAELSFITSVRQRMPHGSNFPL